MITVIATHGEEQDAVNMFDEMPREGCHQIVTMMTVLFACMHGGLVDTGMSLLKRMEPGDIRVVLTVEHYGCVMCDGYAW
jgi:pentatricopeptide repeat protein